MRNATTLGWVALALGLLVGACSGNGDCATNCGQVHTCVGVVLSCCGTSCVGLQVDGANCGSCGTVCQPNEICSAGMCVPAPWQGDGGEPQCDNPCAAGEVCCPYTGIIDSARCEPVSTGCAISWEACG